MHKRTHAHTHTRTHSSTHAHTHTHTHTHAHARTHARTHTHTHCSTSEDIKPHIIIIVLELLAQWVLVCRVALAVGRFLLLGKEQTSLLKDELQLALEIAIFGLPHPPHQPGSANPSFPSGFRR